MAKIHPTLHLTELQIDEMLSTEKTLRIATVGPGEMINLTPMTFGWANGKIYIYGRGQKIANVRRNATATILVDIGDRWRELKGLMIQGKAEVLETLDDESLEPDLEAAKLNLGNKHRLGSVDQPEPYRATASGRTRRWIVFHPARYVSWDNQKLPVRDDN